jgi:subtilisin family serine protease
MNRISLHPYICALGALFLLLGLGNLTALQAQRVALEELPELLPGPPRPPAPKPIDNLILLDAETIDVRRVAVAANLNRINDGLARLGLAADQPTYYLVHTALPANAVLLAAFRARGGEPVSFVPRNAYIVRGNEAAIRAIAALPGVDLVTIYHPVHRISPPLVAKLPAMGGPATVSVLLFNGENPLAAREAFAGLGGIILATADTIYGPLLRVRLDPAQVPLLANMSGVQWVEEYIPPKFLNDAATGFGSVSGTPANGIMDIEPVWGQGLDGSGMIVGHADTGLDIGVNDTTIHDDFENADGTGTRITAGLAWGRPTTIASDTTDGWGRSLSSTYEAARFTAGLTTTVEQVVLRFWTDSTPTGTLQCSLYSHNVGTGNPDASMGTAVNTLNMQTLDGYLRAYRFLFDPPIAVTNGTNYWVVLDRTNASGSFYVNLNISGGVHRTSSNGTTWSSTNPNDAWYYEVLAPASSGTWYDPDGHGTHTAGSILGNGRASPTAGQFRGPAYAANLVHQSVVDTSGNLGGVPTNISVLFQQAYLLGARIHSNSWGSDVNGDYDISSMEVDAFVWNFPDTLLVFSAGNAGVDTSGGGDGVIDPGSMGSPASAKDCLAVGATESVRSGSDTGFNGTWYQGWGIEFGTNPIRDDHVSNNYNGMAAFSSRGPCDDNRIKPDVVTPGTNIVSCQSKQPGATIYRWGPHSDPDYAYMGGTSMACPLAAGVATLAREFFVEKKSRTPSAALIKATLIHGATDLQPGQYGTGTTQEVYTAPDNSQGWGRVDLNNSLYPTTTTYFMDATAASGLALTDTSGPRSASVTVNSSTPLKATLVWTDPPSNPAGTGGLINDLDLRIYRRNEGDTEDEEMHLPKGVAGGAAGDDATNNVEQVEVTSPTNGRVYRIEVSVSSSLNASYPTQPFALIVSGNFITPTPVRISEGRVERRGAAAYLTWQVDEAEGLAGCRLYRADSVEGPFQPLAPGLLRADGPTYVYTDRTAPRGEVYYEVEWVGVDGRATRYGPLRLAAAGRERATLRLRQGQ